MDKKGRVRKALVPPEEKEEKRTETQFEGKPQMRQVYKLLRAHLGHKGYCCSPS